VSTPHEKGIEPSSSALDGVTRAIERVDDLCNVFAGLARAAEQRGWPEDATRAAAALTRRLEQLAGDLDGAADPHHVRVLLGAARLLLPAAFNAFGKAFGETLQSGELRLRRLRGRA